MNVSPEKAQVNVEALTEKMLGAMGFTKGQEVQVSHTTGGGEVVNYWIHGIELEIQETGSTSGYNREIQLEHLLNKSNENTDTPITVGTVVTFDDFDPTAEYGNRTQKITKNGTVVLIRVVVYDCRLRPRSFDPNVLKIKSQ